MCSSDLEAIRKGAMGLVRKEADPDTIVRAIREVDGGAAWLEPALMGAVLSQLGKKAQPDTDPEKRKIETLTAREREVAQLTGEGVRAKDIASRLFISEITVRHHLTSIFSKLGVTDRVDLMVYAYRNGLAKAPTAAE